MTGFSFTDYLPYILFGIAGISLVMFAIIALITGFSLKKKVSPKTAIKASEKRTKTLIQDFFHWWGKVGSGILNFFGIVPQYPIHTSFSQAMKWLKEHLDGSDYAYQLPWAAVVGEPQSGKTTLINNIGLLKPFSQPHFSDTPENPSLSWWFYEKGVVLDIGGNNFLEKNIANKHRSWSHILKNLMKYRECRPIDSIILTIPCSHFIGPDALDSEDIQQRAQIVATQLRKAERRTGLKLPIYIMITKCDNIAGFSGFCNALPKEKLGQIFGWSNPYTLDSIFNESWLKKALSDTVTYATKSTLDICQESELTQYQDDVMTFITEFNGINDGLTQYVSSIFQSYNYRNHFMLRGIYFTGNMSTDLSDINALNADFQGEGGSVPTQKAKILPTPFLNDFFEKKVFPERNLAAPTKKFLISANNKINAMKVLILGAVLGSIFSLHIGRQQLISATNSIYPSFKKLSYSMRYLDLYEQKEIESFATDMKAYFQNEAENILGLIVLSHTVDLQPWLLPGSLLTNTHGRVHKAVRIGFNKIITKSIYMDLVERANRIISRPLPTLNNTENGSALLNPLETSEFLVLQGYVDALKMLEKASYALHNLAKHPSITDISFVANYLYGFTFNIEFLERYGDHLLEIINNANYESINLDNYRLLAQARLYNLFMNFLNRILDPHYNYKFAIDLQKTLQAIEGTDTTVPQLKKLKNSLNQIHQLEDFVNDPKFSWIGENNFNPGGDFTNVVGSISSIALFGKTFVRNLSAKVNKRFTAAQKNLESYGSPLTGYFVIRNESNTLQASPGVQNMAAGLEDFLNEPFMQEVAYTQFSTNFNENQILFWDPSLLKSLTHLIESYHNFIHKKLPSYAPGLKESFKLLSEKQLEKNANNMLARAQKVVYVDDTVLSSTKESHLLSQVMNLQSVGDDFLILLQHLKANSDFSLYLKLRNFIFDEMFKALQKLDGILESRGLYQPYYNDFSWWDGKEGIIMHAYDFLDSVGMKEYLANQYKQVNILAIERAVPIVTFLSSDIFNLDITQTALVDKWTKLIEDVKNYKSKKSNNPVKNLEKFLIDTGNKITIDNCFTEISPQTTLDHTNDFFIKTEQNIKARIYQQCQDLSVTKAVNKVQALIDFFNANLAGAFPFTSEVNGATIPSLEATQENIQEFFSLYDTLLPEELALLKNLKKYKNLPQVLSFLDKTRDVKIFFNDYFMPATANGTPGLNFHIEFRVNQLYESHGNHVINWGFAAGNNTFDTTNGKYEGRWTLGDVAAFAFKWASDATLRPMVHSTDPAYMNVHNRGMYMYEGQWAVLRALMLNQAPLDNGALPNDSTLLEFKIPLSTHPDQGAPDTHAMLFVRLTPKPSKPSANKKFVIPKFPNYAPTLT